MNGPRSLTGIALLLAPWGLLVANLGYAWATRDGSRDDTGAQTLALIAAQPGLVRVVLTAGMISCLLLVPAVIGLIGLTRSGAPRLGLTGGALMIAGYVCYLGILDSQFIQITMATSGGPTEQYAQLIDTAMADPTNAWVFGLFVLGNIVGTFLVGLALLRSRTVPAWAAAGILSWPSLHVVGLAVGSEWFEVTGGFLQGVGMAVAGVVVLRTRATHDAPTAQELSSSEPER